MKNIENKKIEKYLNELSEEYKELLFEALLKSSNSVENISVSNLLWIDYNAKRYLKAKNEKNRKIFLFGILYIFLSLFTYWFSDIILKFFEYNFLNPIELIQVMAVVMGFLGGIACLYPIYHTPKSNRNMKKYDGRNNKLLEYEIICSWRELEAICNDISVDEKVITNKSIIETLKNENIISQQEQEVLINFLRLRNAIIHDGKIDASPNDIKKNIAIVNQLIEKLKKIL